MKNVLCLDWDKRSLRIVVARLGGTKTVLADAHSHCLPDDVDAEDPEALGAFIKQMLRRHRLSHRRVVVDVPRERAVINRLSLPPTPNDEVAAAVRFQAMKELPFPVDSAAIDFVVMGRDEKGLATEVLLAAVTIDTLNRTRATCEAAGLVPMRIGLRPYANLVSARHVIDTSEQRVLFVDVGPGATEIDVIHNESLVFARSANVHVPVPNIEHPPTGDAGVVSIADIDKLTATADEALDGACEELVVEVMRTLQAYRATEADAGIDCVMIAGGTGVEGQLAERVQARLGYEVHLFDPTDPLDVDPAEGPKLRSFSAALGLAWGMTRGALVGLDFLNPKRPVSSREVLQRRVRLVSLAAATVLIAVIGTTLWKYNERVAELEALETKNRTLWEDKVKPQTAVLNQVELVAEWTAQPVWPEELLTLSEMAIDPGKKMVVREIEMETLSRNPGITLRDVYAADWQVLTEFVKQLNDFEVEGEQPYEAVEGTFTPLPDGKKFQASTDILVGLREIEEHRRGEAARARERKDRLKRP